MGGSEVPRYFVATLIIFIVLAAVTTYAFRSVLVVAIVSAALGLMLVGTVIAVFRSRR